MAIKNSSKNLGVTGYVKTLLIESGATGTSDPKVVPMAQSLGIGFDANNAVTSNTTTGRLDNLEVGTHTHANKAILDATNASYTVTIDTHVDDLETRLAAAETAIGLLVSHTHDYDDDNGTTTVTKTTTSN